MTRAVPRTAFHSSKLIRCLADLAMVDAVEPGDTFAEKLGLWIHFADAITLSAVHGDDSAGLPVAGREARPVPRVGLDAEFDRIQADLTNAIVASCSPGTGKAHMQLPTPILELPLDLKAAYAPYGRFYDAHQRNMELSIQPLRFNVRARLAKSSPRLKKLADLDATFEKILRERESKLLARLPLLLKKRFEHLFKSHQQKLADAGQDDKPAHWIKADGWLARFCGDMQMLLLAELELRLQPTLGLIEAFKQDTQ